MIKSNRDIKEIVDFGRLRDVHAEGRVRIDLTDPLTGKTKERVEGKNLVFEDGVFCGDSGNWKSNISGMWMCLNDSDTALSASFPLLLGQTIGYGRPSTAGLGTLRGAYNVANQVLAAVDLTKARWKFQYDFTTAQANGTIKNVGLTRQYEISGGSQMPLVGLQNATKSFTYADTSDCRYSFTISTVGVITRYDWWLGVTATIDVSVTVGTVGGNPKSVGYAPATGKYYVWVYSATAASRRMYQFSGPDFGTLENTYSPSNVAINVSAYPFYVYGNKMFMLTGTNGIHVADFIANTAHTALTLSAYNAAAYAENSYAQNGYFYYGSVGIGKYIVSLCPANLSIAKGIIFDMSTESVVGYVCPYLNATNDNHKVATFKYPLGDNGLICQHNGTVGNRSALTSYLLPTPVTKTSANGMTATYELEVYW